MKEMMAEMKMEMNERLSLAEGKLAKTEADLAVTKDALAKSITDQATKEDLAVTKEALMSKTDELEREVAILKAPPYIHACGSHYERLSASYITIPYTFLLYSTTNQEDWGLEGGGLDITRGVFTAPFGGSYTVSWDPTVSLDHGEAVDIYLQKN